MVAAFLILNSQKHTVMKKEFQSGTSYVPSFRTGSTDVNTIQHRYFQELEKDCSVNSASDAYYLSAIAWFCLTFIFPPAVIGAVVCVYRAKKVQKGGRK
jgi:hypothetical protein